jgi:hypothetical protein
VQHINCFINNYKNGIVDWIKLKEKETKIQEVQNTILRKQALELLWEDTTEVETELTSKVR